MNDNERRLWIENDEGLYNWWKRSGKGQKSFIRANRQVIDNVINNVLSGRKPAHYLVYGPKEN